MAVLQNRFKGSVPFLKNGKATLKMSMSKAFLGVDS